MGRGASVVTYTVDDENADELHRRIAEHLVPAARELHGYRGLMLLDQGNGKRLALLIFDSVDDVGPAQAALTPVGRDHTYALMSGPAEGSMARVVLSDGFFGDPAQG